MKQLLAILLIYPLIAAFAAPAGPTDEGNRAFAAGKYDDALRAYQEAVSEDPGKAGAHYNLGDAYYKKGEYDKALGEYQQAVKHDPKMAEAHYNAGDTLYKLGRYDDALEAYRRADTLRKGDKDTEHNIAVTMKRVQQKPADTKKQPGDQKSQQGNGPKKQGQKGQPGQQKQPSSGQGQGSGQSQGGGQNYPPLAGSQQMSEEDVQALLDRQSKEEKNLRNYFRPGRKDGRERREEQVAQMLRGSGMPGLGGRPMRPGAPYVEKDW